MKKRVLPIFTLILLLCLLPACGGEQAALETTVAGSPSGETSAAPESEPDEETPAPVTPQTAAPRYASDNGEVFGYAMIYGDTVYETGRYGVLSWTVLPMEASSFYIFEEAVYYVAAGDGEAESAALYQADMDGGNQTLLADNVSLSIRPHVVNGSIFYVDNGGAGGDEESPGIHALDMNTLASAQIVQTLYCDILGSDGEYVYYKYYENETPAIGRVRLDGSGQERMEVEVGGGLVYSGGYFFASIGDAEYAVMCIDPLGEERSYTYAFTYDGMGFAVADGWMYYGDGETISRTSVDGETTEEIAVTGAGTYWAHSFFLIEDYLYFCEMTDADAQGGNTVFCRVPLTGGDREALAYTYMS